MSGRYAIYAAPPAASALWRVASAWLGRDAETGSVAAPDLPPWLDPGRWSEITASPRHYGFHGTLKPPMFLAEDRHEADLIAALGRFAKAVPAPPPVPLALSEIGGCLALLPRVPLAALDHWADLAVVRFDGFRAPPTTDELKRRRAAPLSPRQHAYVARWGYPHVLDDFRFHMTLTGPLAGEEQVRLADHLAELLHPLVEKPVALELALFAQPDPLAPFDVIRRFRP